jgi:hypothetical protein
MIEIPKHNCRNCGDCCGPIAATKKELTAPRQESQLASAVG